MDNAQLTISWNAVSGATSYNVYWSTTTGVTTANGTKITAATSPYLHTGRTNGIPYYYVVTSVTAGGESPASAEVNEKPMALLLPMATGQIQCWNAAGTLIACTGTGQDGALQLGRAANFTVPTPHGTYSTDYTTKDNVTGLVWKSCSEGLSGAACATGTAYLNAADLTTCPNLNSANTGAGYAGRTTWRLPTIEELETLINYNAQSPASFATGFPTTVTGGYWSSSAYIRNTNYAWYMSSTAGYVGSVVKTSIEYARCVSTGP
jgi:hypothetical protein